MKLGMIGLGRMGGNMVQRLEQDGHDVVTYTRSGGGTAPTIEELVSELEPPRVAWMMVPAGDATETTFCSACSSRATSSSTAGTRISGTRNVATQRRASKESASPTPACPEGSGASRSATA
jgi:nucleoside-diphosphate-sugar epimerase